MEKGNEITRRRFLKRSVVAAGGVAATVGLGTAISRCDTEYSKDPGRPNIILITADDLGWKDLGCYGNQEIRTPNLDKLANNGVRFTNAFVVSSSCAPSRASLITGQYPHTNGVTALTHIKKTRCLSPFAKTLPSILKDKGYNTALMGKWHPSPYLPTSLYGYNERLSGLFPKDWKIKDATKINEFISNNADNRFYLEINFMQNHRDGYGEFEFADGFKYDPKKLKVPDYWTLPDWPEIKEEVAKFYSQTSEMDHVIGDLIQKLEELNLLENTLVVFLSDNGPPFPGNKMTLYDRGAGTPLIMHWPAKITERQINSQLTNSIDIMPSILKALNIDIPEEIEGRSNMHPLVGKETKDSAQNDAIFMEMTDHVFYIPTRAVRTERWKYIANYSDIALGLDQNNHMEWAHRLCELPNQPWKSPRPREELYDLHNDPNEQVNLIDEQNHKKVLTELKTKLKDHMKRTADPYLNANFTSDYDTRSYTPSIAGEKY